MKEKLSATNPIPKVEAPAPPLAAEENYLTDDKFTDGLYKLRKTGEPFALCKHAPNSYERTHSAKNSVHFWQGTEDEFNLAFEKA